MARGYRELPHTADVALEVWGRDLQEFYVHAAEGLFDLAVSPEPRAPITAWREVALSAPDEETLLVDWLNELLLLADEHGEAYVSFEVSLPAPGQLAARVGATRAFTPKRAIKAATFHDLTIERVPEGYRAVIVFDV
ncbi:MAG: archease [Anaerolineae bacterium]|nr:archease [Anaerolineae bacterium]